jgi:hypothetical protein
VQRSKRELYGKVATKKKKKKRKKRAAKKQNKVTCIFLEEAQLRFITVEKKPPHGSSCQASSKVYEQLPLISK